MDILSLPVYQCFKKVRAFKIEKIDYAKTVGENYYIYSEELEEYVVNSEWIIRHKPQVGGYIVFYSDDYVSYSPASAFESGYKRIE